MITKERYDQLCKCLLAEGFDKSHIVEFNSITEKWNEMLDIITIKSQMPNLASESLQLSYLFTLRWGVTAIASTCKNNGVVQMAFSGLFTTIANTILAIIKLAIDGLDYQASVLIRNLYELCFAMLSVIIDPIKRKVLVDSTTFGDEYNTWSKHFRFKELDKTIKAYENKIATVEPNSFLNTWRKKHYSIFSSYVHNDFSTFLLYGYALPQNDEDNLMINVWGHYSSRLDIITGNINALLWYTEMLFIRLLTDKDIEINNKDICKDENDNGLWNLASFLGILAEKYYMEIKIEESYEEK